MKIVYEEGEKERLKHVYDLCKEISGSSILFNDKDLERIYSLDFKVTNPTIAEYILLGLLHNKLQDFDLGIDVVSINLNSVTNTDKLKTKLHEMIEDIIK